MRIFEKFGKNANIENIKCLHCDRFVYTAQRLAALLVQLGAELGLRPLGAPHAAAPRRVERRQRKSARL
ncbi:hypothetical protein EYF80_033069 [Liparis tanakae]|uniref:Uncharacterized protein n=1 Tax=Liparis tanakae TaxID=230148 RepID=A0A4Z2GVX9_9TELE|nr:hypothetical protein EYF80_033069 [Liparis tanakae]